MLYFALLHMHNAHTHPFTQAEITIPDVVVGTVLAIVVAITLGTCITLVTVVLCYFRRSRMQNSF